MEQHERVADARLACHRAHGNPGHAFTACNVEGGLQDLLAAHVFRYSLSAFHSYSEWIDQVVSLVYILFTIWSIVPHRYSLRWSVCQGHHEGSTLDRCATQNRGGHG